MKNIFYQKCVNRWVCLLGLMILLLSFGVCFAEKNEAPLYELYPTQNIYTFLKLNTMTGAVSQLQYSVDDVEMRVEAIVIREYELESMSRKGRFKLYPTHNMYNFLLLDQDKGIVRQIQWSNEPENRGIIRAFVPAQ